MDAKSNVKEDWFVNLYLTPRDSVSFNPDAETAYLIEGSSGTYDLFTTFAVTVKRTLEAAQKFVIEHEEWRTRTESMAVKNDTEYGNYEYDKLLDEYNDYIYKKLFPNKGLNEALTDKEDDAYEEYYIEESNFIEWMTKVKGLSEETAQATIDYNSDEKSEYNTSYNIIRINIED